MMELSAESTCAATFSIQSRDAYYNVRSSGQEKFIVKVLSDACQAPSAAAALCQPYGPEKGQDSGSASAGSFLTSDLFAVNSSDAACLLAHGRLKLPSRADLTISPSSYVGLYVVFSDAAGGDCNGRWAQVVAYNRSTRCANISTSATTWADGLAACTDLAEASFYLAAPAAGATRAYPPLSCPRCEASSNAIVTNKGSGYYLVSYTASGRGSYSVFGALSGGQGLTATYYSNTDTVGTSVNIGEGDPVSTRVHIGNIDWSSSPSRPRPLASLSAAQGFGVRWTGFVAPCLSQTYTFAVSMHHTAQTQPVDSRVKLWVDNTLLIDQWSSLTHESPTGRVPLLAHEYHDISMLYKCPTNASACRHTLEWKSGAATASSLVPPAALHRRIQMDGKLGHLRVAGGFGCVTTSTASGMALTLATAGVYASFTITSRDAYGNPRDSVEPFFPQLIGSGNSPLYGGLSAPLTPLLGTSIGTYLAFEAKTYQLLIQQGGGHVKGSPFTLTVLPDRVCGSMSTLSGNALTAASLAPAVNTFSLQARDSFANRRSDLGVQGEAFLVRVVRTRSPNTQGAAYGGLPGFSGSTALADPGDIPTLHAALTDSGGELAGSYSIPIIPSPAGQAHYLHSSWIQRGGLHATYYSADYDTTSTSKLPVPCSACRDGHKFPPTVSSGGSSTSPSVLDPALVGSSSVCGSGSCNLVIRWAGAIRACESSGDDATCLGAPSYRRDFKWTIAAEDRVKLWIDNKLIIDQWSSLSVSSPSGAAVFRHPHTVLDIMAEYQRLATDVLSSSPVELLDTGRDGSFQPLHSMRLYRTEYLKGSPTYINVYPT